MAHNTSICEHGSSGNADVRCMTAQHIVLFVRDDASRTLGVCYERRLDGRLLHTVLRCLVLFVGCLSCRVIKEHQHFHHLVCVLACFCMCVMGAVFDESETLRLGGKRKGNVARTNQSGHAVITGLGSHP